MFGPEQSLAYSTIVYALRDFVTDETRLPRRDRCGALPNVRDVRQARDWILNHRDYGKPGSFNWTCEAIGVHAGMLRTLVERLWNTNRAELAERVAKLNLYLGRGFDDDDGEEPKLSSGVGVVECPAPVNLFKQLMLPL